MRFPMWLPGPRKVIVVHEEPRAVVIGHLRDPGTVRWWWPTPTCPSCRGGAGGNWAGSRRDLAAFADPVVLMGDLNMPAPKPAAITGYRSLADAPDVPGGAARPAARSHSAARRLGRVTGSGAPLLPLSDHRALYVDLEPHHRSGSTD